MEEREFYDNLLVNVVQPILNSYAENRQLTVLSKKLGIEHRSRLTELKNGIRKLTFFWLSVFIKGGVMGVDQILKGRKIEELSKIEKTVVLRLDPDEEELALLYKAKRKNINIRKVLESLVSE